MKNIFKSWKTSSTGLVAGGTLIFDGISTKDWAKVVEGAALILMGILAKDSGVTGV